MMKLTILLVVTIAQQAYCDEPKRIVDGTLVKPDEFPHQISLRYYGSHICGGSIIGRSTILTAAHCVTGSTAKSLTVATGTLSSRGQVHKIKRIRIHSKYTDRKRKSGRNNDIAVITLEKPIQKNDLQAPISLASKDYANSGKIGIVIGWGKTSLNLESPLLLRWHKLNISSNNCKDIYGAAITERQLCTFNRGFCQGDNSGSLIVDNELVGIFSWGIAPCTKEHFDVYTNVFQYRDFIKQSQQKC